ncbi:MAG: hypothetical protein HQM06_09910 [Magnetococcales bacterium]|nr:hypothetical protein [Magnetococcales bacterium]
MKDLTVSLPDDVIEMLDSFANQGEISVSDLVTAILLLYTGGELVLIEEPEPPPPTPSQ